MSTDWSTGSGDPLDNDVGVATMDRPESLKASLANGLKAALYEVVADASVHAVTVTCAVWSSIPEGDIKYLHKVSKPTAPDESSLRRCLTQRVTLFG